jgi:biotin carboxylase
MSRALVLSIGGKDLVCGSLRQLGAEILLVQTPSRIDAEISSISMACSSLLVDYEQYPELLIELITAFHRIRPLSACISFAEQGLSISAKICELLDLPGMPPVSVVQRTRNKLLMRQTLSESGLTPVAAALGTNRDELKQFGEQNGFPIVIKPHMGVGSVQVHLIASENDLPVADRYESFLMEEFLPGREFSVETFSDANQHMVIGVTEKAINSAGFGNPFLEEAHQFPANLSVELFRQLKDYVFEILVRLSIADGPCHTEVKLTPKGFRIVETHTRFGGDNIVDLVRIVTGLDLVAMAVARPLGLLSRVPREEQLAEGAAIRYFLPRPGIVKNITGLEFWRRNPAIYRIDLPLAVGDRVPAPTVSHKRVGYVIAMGRSSDDAARLCRQVCDGIRIETE